MTPTVSHRLSLRLRLALLAALAMASVVAARPAGAVETGFINKIVKAGGQSLPYVVYVPRDYSAEKRCPVILFLHGAGERGDNGLSQSQVGSARPCGCTRSGFRA